MVEPCLHEEMEIHNLPVQFIAEALACLYILNILKCCLGVFTSNTVKDIQNNMTFFASKHLSTCMIYRNTISHSLGTFPSYHGGNMEKVRVNNLL
jgi:hypothetical protein